MLLILLCWLFTRFEMTVAVGNNTMIVVWGKPTKLTAAVVNSTLNQDQCVQACLDNLQCVAAHIMLNTTTCNMFLYSSAPNVTITKTTAINASVVAFKVSGSDVCPIGENAPTFDNKTASGYILDNSNPALFPSKVYYNISFVNNAWKFSNKIVYSCLGPFTGYIQHADGNDACVTIYQIRKTTDKNVVYIGLNQTFSVDSCATIPATLPGINYANDLAYFDWYIKLYSSYFPTNTTYVRIDGRRTTACQATPTTPTCMSPEGFTFTDKAFKNFDNYNWVTDSSARNGTDDDCLVYVVNGTAPLQVDVKSCTAKNTIQAFGHLCVTPAYQE